MFISARRDADAARRFFRRALSALKVTPAEVVTDAAEVYPSVLDELIPAAWHHVELYTTNPIEAHPAGSNTDYARCAAYEQTEQPPSSSPGTPSCRT